MHVLPEPEGLLVRASRLALVLVFVCACSSVTRWEDADADSSVDGDAATDGPVDAEVEPPREDGVVIVWGGFDGSDPLSDGGVYDPRTDTWSFPEGLSQGPLGTRSSHSAVWTGEGMIVWGGSAGPRYADDGAVYDLDTDSWSTPLGLVSAPIAGRRNHAAVWTGSQMIVWGGYPGTNGELGDGALYDPASDSWSTPPGLSTSPLQPRRSPAAVWDGERMLIWGGVGYVDEEWVNFDDGAAYDPVSDRWTVTAGFTANDRAPSGRSTSAAVWTGSQMIVWGGAALVPFADGAAYLPGEDDWAAPAGLQSGDSPLRARSYPGAAWTGSQMIVWGGNDERIRFSDGAVYDPSSDSWALPAGLGGPAAPTHRSAHSVVWAAR